MNISKNAIIFTGGIAPLHQIILWDIDLIVVADAGIKVCKAWNLMPDVILGDFDSFSMEKMKEYAPHAEYFFYQEDKDYTDTELALQYCYEHKSTDITIVGGFGGRIDHFMAILHLFKQSHFPNRIIGDMYQCERIDTCAHIDTTAIVDKYISFFPLTQTTSQMSTGLHWNLDNLILDDEHISISNEYIDTRVDITMKTGSILAVWKHGDEPQQTLTNQE